MISVFLLSQVFAAQTLRMLFFIEVSLDCIFNELKDINFGEMIHFLATFL